MNIAHMLRYALSGMADIMFPRQCEMCGRRLAISESLVCTTCNLSLPRTDDPMSPYDNHTARLLWGRVGVERCVSFVYYHPHTSAAMMVYKMKYGGRDDIAGKLGRLMAHELVPTGFFDSIDGIVPMPLHDRRRRERGYNQSYEMAQGIRSVTHIDIYENIVERTRYTESQARQTLTGRAKNVVGAFALKDARRAEGKHLPLIDDIITTGATLAECAEQLAKISGVRISILTFGRTEG